MDDQKIEPVLNLALDASPAELEKSAELETGYDEQTDTWEVIVRFSGPAEALEDPMWTVAALSGGYAIVTLPQPEIDRLAALPQVEYIEKPKRLYFETDVGRAASCVSSLQIPPYDLRGTGVLVAVIDSGIDYFHPDFRNDDGSTRILAMWDQTAAAPSGVVSEGNSSGAVDVQVEEERRQRGDLPLEDNSSDGVDAQAEEEQRQRRDLPPAGSLSGGENGQVEEERRAGSGLPPAGFSSGVENDQVEEERRAGSGLPPAGFSSGVEYTREDINEALRAGSREAALQIVPERDASGHGTQVAGIAAGNGRASGGRYRGMAPESAILVVKLGMPGERSFPRTTELMQALEYVVRKAEEYRMPVAINLSFGNAYGSHRGTSLLEGYIDRMAERGRSVISAGTGNEGNSGGHAAGRLTEGQEAQISFVISDFERSLNLQLWKNYADVYTVTVVHPDGRRVVLFGGESGAYRYRLGNVTLLIYYGVPSPYQVQQEIFIDFLPDDTYLDSGIWSVILTPERIVTGDYELWMPDARARSPETRFLQPDPSATLTIPSSAARVIAVGAYDARSNAYASFSGRGWRSGAYDNHPDLVAPGVSVTTTAADGGYVSVTGTSFATPFVTGAAALLMQWGIVNGNDPFLFGEKVKAYLRRGARPLPGFDVFPNNQVGYGALCVRESIPG